MVTITPAASEQLRGILAEQAGENLGLRLFVQGACGCGNVGYGMGIDEPSPMDSVFDANGVSVILDPSSATLLRGATIDFLDEGARGRGFVIQTADHTAGQGGCGCGH